MIRLRVWTHTLALAVFIIAGCSTLPLISDDEPAQPPVESAQPLIEPTQLPEGEKPDHEGAVSIRESTITWQTVAYQLEAENRLRQRSIDGSNMVTQVFSTWILENEYLSVTLLPEYGGRILSLVYKPTGHEELYQNPVGLPYQIGSGIFYYDWLMVYGGIFPTFPEPEHGKTWLLPWGFEIVTETQDEVTVAMSIVDDVDFAGAPPQYDLGATGLEVTLYVTLQAGRAALDTEVTISNPGAKPVDYEFWMNATLAPGSPMGNPASGAETEIIVPVELVKMPPWWPETTAQEVPTGLVDVYELYTLRWFKNWPDMGIAYAYPDMQGRSFWGAINHDNEEGFFRIADNTITPGLKIWTWGYPRSSKVDPLTGDDEARPYIELWAGVTREFWQRTTLDAEQKLSFRETYAPSAGMVDVTHATENFLVDLKQARQQVQCQVFGFDPGQTVGITLSMGSEQLFEELVILDPADAVDCSSELATTEHEVPVELVIADRNGGTLFRGTATQAE